MVFLFKLLCSFRVWWLLPWRGLLKKLPLSTSAAPISAVQHTVGLKNGEEDQLGKKIWACPACYLCTIPSVRVCGVALTPVIPTWKLSLLWVLLVDSWKGLPYTCFHSPPFMQPFKNAEGTSFSTFKIQLKLLRGDPGSRHSAGLVSAVASGDGSCWPGAALGTWWSRSQFGAAGIAASKGAFKRRFRGG